jgi:hypothetical protein
MSNKEDKESKKIETTKLKLEAIVMRNVAKLIEQEGQDGLSEEDAVSVVMSAFAEMTVKWTKCIAKLEARLMAEDGVTHPRYEAEQVTLVMLAELGDREGLDFGRFLSLTKDDEGVWHSPDEQNPK